MKFCSTKDFVHFTSIPMTYTKLFPNLFRNGLVVVYPPKPLQPSYPNDANTKCNFHGGVCWSFHRKMSTFLIQGTIFD